MWKSLTEEEKKELLEAEKESQDPSDLINHEEVQEMALRVAYLVQKSTEDSLQ